MKKEICGVKYEIKPMPPSLTPYSARIIALLQRTPQNVEEAREASKELRILIKELLKETVQPEPLEEHELEVYNTLIQVTNQTLEKVKFFPQNKRPSVEEGSPISPVTSQTPQ